MWMAANAGSNVSQGELVAYYLGGIAAVYLAMEGFVWLWRLAQWLRVKP